MTTTAERRESGGVAAVELNATEVTEDTLRGKYYDKKRIPAYTDRVLFRSLPGFVGNLRLQVRPIYRPIYTLSSALPGPCMTQRPPCRCARPAPHHSFTSPHRSSQLPSTPHRSSPIPTTIPRVCALTLLALYLSPLASRTSRSKPPPPATTSRCVPPSSWRPPPGPWTSSTTRKVRLRVAGACPYLSLPRPLSILI